MMQPIETTFLGIRFRSRLEARWAAFFHVLGVKWTYEIEAYRLSTGDVYLPDFKIDLETETVWCEVKPKGGDIRKFIAFMRELPSSDNVMGTVLSDPPEIVDMESHYQYINSGWGSYEGAMWRAGETNGENCGHDGPYWFSVCGGCGASYFTFMGWNKYGHHKSGCVCADEKYARDSKLIAAYRAARTTRFW